MLVTERGPSWCHAACSCPSVECLCVARLLPGDSAAQSLWSRSQCRPWKVTCRGWLCLSGGCTRCISSARSAWAPQPAQQHRLPGAAQPPLAHRLCHPVPGCVSPYLPGTCGGRALVGAVFQAHACWCAAIPPRLPGGRQHLLLVRCPVCPPGAPGALCVQGGSIRGPPSLRGRSQRAAGGSGALGGA